MRPIVLAIVLALAVPAAVAAQLLPGAPNSTGTNPLSRTPAAVGAPVFAQLTSLEGLPADSTVRYEFMRGLRDAFAESQLACERGAGADWQAGGALPNRFALLEGYPADDAWNVRLVIGAPAPAVVQKRATQGDAAKRRMEKSRRASRGMIVSVTAASPESREKKLAPVTTTVAFAFPAPPPPADASQVVTSSGYEYSWMQAGRRAGILALEALHRDAGALGADQRFDLAPAVRTATGR